MKSAGGKDMEGAIWREWGTARTYQRLQTISSSISLKGKKRKIVREAMGDERENEGWKNERWRMEGRNVNEREKR